MNAGDLVMVRLAAKSKEGLESAGIIIRKFSGKNPPTFEVLVEGERWVVTDKDIRKSYEEG